MGQWAGLRGTEGERPTQVGGRGRQRGRAGRGSCAAPATPPAGEDPPNHRASSKSEPLPQTVRLILAGFWPDGKEVGAGTRRCPVTGRPQMGTQAGGERGFLLCQAASCFAWSNTSAAATRRVSCFAPFQARAQLLGGGGTHEVAPSSQRRCPSRLQADAHGLPAQNAFRTHSHGEWPPEAFRKPLLFPRWLLGPRAAAPASSRPPP